MEVQSIAENTDRSIVLNDIVKNCFSKKPEFSLNDQLRISSIGKRNPINIGTKHIKKHKKDFLDDSFLICIGLKFEEIVEKLALLLEILSMTKQKVIKIKSIEANCIAVVKSYIPSQVLKIPVVNVETAK